MLNEKMDCLQDPQIDKEHDIEIKIESNGQEEPEEKSDCLDET